MCAAGIVLTVLSLDMLTKKRVGQALDEHKETKLFSGQITLKRVKNYGLCGGFLSEAPYTSAALSGLTLSIMTPVSFYVKKKESRLAYLSFVTILAGGLANLYDRLKNGYVTDFIRIKKGRVYNTADFFIIIGSVLFWLAVLLKDGKEAGQR